jgi:hypothetical protein
MNTRTIASAAAAALLLINAAPASAQRWHYEMYVQHEQSARHVGKAEGNVSYRPMPDPNKKHLTVDGCYNAETRGSAKDLAKDGNSVKVYFLAKDCLKPFTYYRREVAFAGKPEDPPDTFAYAMGKIKDASIEICTWTQKRGDIKCRCQGPCKKKP